MADTDYRCTSSFHSREIQCQTFGYFYRFFVHNVLLVQCMFLLALNQQQLSWPIQRQCWQTACMVGSNLLACTTDVVLAPWCACNSVIWSQLFRLICVILDDVEWIIKGNIMQPFRLNLWYSQCNSEPDSTLLASTLQILSVRRQKEITMTSGDKFVFTDNALRYRIQKYF